MKRLFFCGIIAILLFSRSRGFGQVSYTITDLGSGVANAINASGQVVGQNGNNDILFYSNGMVQDLGNGDGLGINDSGQIVGYDNAFGSNYSAFLDTNGSFQTIGGNQYEAIGINDSGVVVGDVNHGSQAWIYSNGSFQNILAGSAYAINATGQVAGANADGNAFLYSNGSIKDLTPFVQGHGSSGTAINSSGQVVGTYGADIAFLYTNNSLQNLGAGKANGINDSGQIVGTDGGNAYLYSSGGSPKNLNSLIAPSSGWTLTNATAINNLGQIAADGTNALGQSHALLLTPTPPLAPTNLLVNPNFYYYTNGDGTQVGNTSAGVVSPAGSYTIGTGPNAEFHGVSQSGGQFPVNGTANFPGWSSVGVAGAQNINPSLYYTPPSGPTGYTNGGSSAIYQTLPGALIPNTTYFLNVTLNARNDIFSSASQSLYPLSQIELQDGDGNYLAGTGGGNVGVTETPWRNGTGAVSVVYTTGNTVTSSNTLTAYLGGGYQMNYTNAVLLSEHAPATTPTDQPAPSAVITLNTSSTAQLEVFNSTTGQFQKGGTINPLLPTVIFTHGFSSSASQWNSLASEWPSAGVSVNLLAWDWSSDAGSIIKPWTLGQATSRTQNEGAALGDALVAALGSGYTKDIHFIGHSLGTLVNAEAINVFNAHTSDSANTQDTLFDDAEVANLIAGNPPASQWAVDVPTSNHVAWIDNYISAFGDLVNQSNAVNVILRQTTNPALGVYGFHSYPQTWYQSTLPQNNTVSFGYPWSIDRGNVTVGDVPVGQYFSQDLYPANSLSLQSINQTQADNEILARNIAESSQIAVAAGYFLGGNALNSTIQTGGQFLATFTSEAATALAGPSLGLKFIFGTSSPSSPNLSVTSTHAAASTIAPTPSYAWVPISIPQNMDMMSFNFQFNGLDPNDYLAVGINNAQIFALEASYVPDGVLENSGLVDVSQWQGQNIQLFIYDSGIASAGTVDVQDIEFSAVPKALTWSNAGGTGDGLTWDTAGNQNWNNGAAPAIFHAGDNITFNDSNAGNYTVTLNATVSPGSVIVNNSAGNYTISGAGSIAGTGSLTKSGTGSLTLSTANTYSGGTFVTGGLLKILPTSATTSALPQGIVSISGNGILQLANNVTLGSQSASLPATSNVNLTSLSIAGDGTLDINNNHIIINYGSGPDPIASIAAWIGSGFAGGTWTGQGIMSTMAQTNSATYGIGYADAADAGNPAGLAAGQIEVMYTLLGDANLDGAVNGTDFAILATNFNKAVSGWDQGDFNYDGADNGTDFAFMAANFNKGASQSADMAAIDAFASQNGLLADVPEPATATMVVIAGLGIRRRRRTSS